VPLHPAHAEPRPEERRETLRDRERREHRALAPNAPQDARVEIDLIDIECDELMHAQPKDQCECDEQCVASCIRRPRGRLEHGPDLVRLTTAAAGRRSRFTTIPSVGSITAASRDAKRKNARRAIRSARFVDAPSGRPRIPTRARNCSTATGDAFASASAPKKAATVRV
jgi:hypothetical protein